MLIKQIFAGFILVAIFWSTSAHVVSAAVSAEQNRALLLVQIERLLTEVLRLQAILDSRTDIVTPAFSTSYTPYKTVFFPLSFKSIYLVENSQLFNTDKSKNGEVGMVDEQMFDLFTKVIGKKAVSKYVQEWRVFQNNRNDLGAFVELIAGTDKWVVGANQEGFTTNDTQVTQSFANLFVHEYAHILIFEKPGFEEVFKKSFWTNKDINNSVVAEQTSANLRFDILSKYFDNNQSRFVSEYATMNTSEDVAETFVLFVTEPRPTGSTVRDQKILLFYGDSDFVSARTELRTNLRSLGVLK